MNSSTEKSAAAATTAATVSATAVTATATTNPVYVETVTAPSCLTLPAVVVPRLLRDLLDDDLDVEFEVTGSSMSPFIRSNDVVILKPSARRAVRFGDVVARLHGERLLVHRVVALELNGIVTRGDAAPVADPPAAWKDVLGIVVHVKRRGRQCRFGLGAERAAIAWLLHRGWLVPCLRPWRWLARLS